MEVANTILQQLGGRQFLVMTGATNLVGGADSLSFSLPTAIAKDRINKVRVTLTPADDYTVEFFYIRGTKVATVKSLDGVYSDQLQDIFTDTTGLDTRL